ncbi:MAG: PilZ domain-containing protein [Alteraurantiacibacter sp.]|nr:PilZ domain-containing protein [Alteraurantiacibacter sp.]
MVRIAGHNWHMAHLRDLTPEGFRVSLIDMPAVGTELRIRIPGLTILLAEVCWARGFEVGCRFVSPLSPYVFEHLIRQ